MEGKNFKYVAVRGTPFFEPMGSHTAYVSGLDIGDPERQALVKHRITSSPNKNVITLNAEPLKVLNTLSQLGYRLVVSAGGGGGDYMWTMQREVL